MGHFFFFHELSCILGFRQIACTGPIIINPGSVVKNVDLINVFPDCGIAYGERRNFVCV